MVVKGKSHAKLILAGEHSVVYGYPAIALPIETLTVEVTLQSAQISTIKSAVYSGPAADCPPSLKSIYDILPDFMAITGVTLPEFTLKIDSSIPFERGLGSSAALADALINALQAWTQTELTPEIQKQLITASEMRVHGKASGLDALIVHQHHAYWFQHQYQPEIIQVKMPGWLIIADSGQHGHTAAAVKQVQQLLQNDSTKEAWLAHIGEITQKIKHILQDEQGNLQVLGSYLNAIHADLRNFGLSTPFLEQLINHALTLGATGAKLSGGGLGGIVLALAPTYEKAQAIQLSWQSKYAVSAYLLPLTSHT